MPPKAPLFSASLSRVTGEQETLTINCTASTPTELADRIAVASETAQQQLKRSNDRVLASKQVLEDANAAMFARAVRHICEAAGLPVPPGYEPPPAPNGHDAQEGAADAAADSPRASHAPADS